MGRKTTPWTLQATNKRNLNNQPANQPTNQLADYIYEELMHKSAIVLS